MSNKDIVVSSEKGTILNYFGAANTYNPFTNESNMQLVEDLDFKIPERTAIVDAEWVAVSTGLITTSISFLQNCTFQIIDKNSGAKITDLTNIIGEVGNIRFMPSENQIFWFNVDGLRGTFYIHKNHCGHYLKIVSGVFVSTSITSGVLNEMFERSIGVPNYITNINNTLANQNTTINGFQNQIDALQSVINSKPKRWAGEITRYRIPPQYETVIDLASMGINRGFAYLFNVRMEEYPWGLSKVSLNDITIFKDKKHLYIPVSFETRLKLNVSSLMGGTFTAFLLAIGV